MNKYINNYNLEDEDVKYYIMNKIISKKPIDFYGFKIKHILVDEVMDNGEDWYNCILKPFLCNKDVWGIDSSDSNIGLLEIFYYTSKEQIKKEDIEDTYIDLLRNSLSYFFVLIKN